MFMLTNWFTGVRTIKANMERGRGGAQRAGTPFTLSRAFIFIVMRRCFKLFMPDSGLPLTFDLQLSTNL